MQEKKQLIKRNRKHPIENLSLDITELSSFRYRVDSMKEVLSKNAIKNAKLKELRSEIVNSEKLKSHFVENPRDLQLLKHDAPLKVVPVQKVRKRKRRSYETDSV